MSKHSEAMDLTIPPTSAMTLVRGVLSELGWKVEEKGDFHIVGIQAYSLAGFGVKLDISADPVEGGSRILANGNLTGMGPIVSSRLKGEMGNFFNRLKVTMEHKPTSQSMLSDEIERLAALHSQGTLTDEEFGAAKSRLLGSDTR